MEATKGQAYFLCPKCGREYTVADHVPGRRYKCGACREYLQLQPRKPETRKESPRTIGPYRLVRRIGSGGMGAVYLAEQEGTGRQVAVKVLSERAARMPGIEARFRREAAAGTRLDHPNIAATLEMGRDGNHAYIVTEFVAGGSLEGLVAGGKKIEVARAVDIVAGVLEGLQHAHDRGVAHRDIKPSNILLTPEGAPKVIDFGLAMDAEAHTILTMAGTVMGTPSFMSPEQARGERGGPASDQYACGLIAWYLLAGRRPFEGATMFETMQKQMTAPLPPLRPLRPDVPASLEAVLRRMTEKDPARRFPSAGEAARALRRSLFAPAEVPAVPAPPPAPPRTLRLSAARLWIFLAALSALAGIAWLLTR